MVEFEIEAQIPLRFSTATTRENSETRRYDNEKDLEIDRLKKELERVSKQLLDREQECSQLRKEKSKETQSKNSPTGNKGHVATLHSSKRANLQAWQKLGAMPAEEAMEKYIEIVTQLYPTWLDGGVKSGSRGGDDAASNSRGTMGPVFSSLVYEEESENELKIDAIHAFAREGEVENLLRSIESGIPVNAKDSEGRTPLHWAIDRGHLDITKVLIDNNADVNAKDNEGQTPLHYAVVCDREAIAEFLVKHKANKASKDDEGNSPLDLCESNWPCFRDSD